MLVLDGCQAFALGATLLTPGLYAEVGGGSPCRAAQRSSSPPVCWKAFLYANKQSRLCAHVLRTPVWLTVASQATSLHSGHIHDKSHRKIPVVPLNWR